MFDPVSLELREGVTVSQHLQLNFKAQASSVAVLQKTKVVRHFTAQHMHDFVRALTTYNDDGLYTYCASFCTLTPPPHPLFVSRAPCDRASRGTSLEIRNYCAALLFVWGIECFRCVPFECLRFRDKMTTGSSSCCSTLCMHPLVTSVGLRRVHCHSSTQSIRRRCKQEQSL